MEITTTSGSKYSVKWRTHGPNKNIPCLKVERDGVDGRTWTAKCVAVYPDRIGSFLDSKRFDYIDGKMVGYNAAGVITCQFVPDQVRAGMVLVNTKGFKSTVIRQVR